MMVEEAAFKRIHRRIHAHHPGCLADEWLAEPCRDRSGLPAERPTVWSRRNGPWRRGEVLWVGAAPGNAGGLGSGDMGAHGTRIPFGGDVAGANLDVLLGSIGMSRNDTFIVAALNQLPDAGGGEPGAAEIARPVGSYASSLHVLRDTLLAVAPRLVVALGNVALRATIAAGGLEAGAARLPGLGRLRAAGLERGAVARWPGELGPSPSFMASWPAADPPLILWLLHPSAQNMSPHAGRDTAFHQRMLHTRDALRTAAREALGRAIPDVRPGYPESGIYALPEWRERIAPRHERLERLWREKGV